MTCKAAKRGYFEGEDWLQTLSPPSFFLPLSLLLSLAPALRCSAAEQRVRPALPVRNGAAERIRHTTR